MTPTPAWSLLAQAPADASGLAQFVNFVPMLLIFVIFYFLLIAPMRKRQKKLQELVSNLKRGDKVVTTGGIYGEVAAIEDSIIHLKVAESTRIRVAKSAVAGLQGETDLGGMR